MTGLQKWLASMSVNDPTNAERQRRFRERRKLKDAGLIEVTVGPSRYWVSAKTAEKIEAMCRKEAKDG